MNERLPSAETPHLAKARPAGSKRVTRDDALRLARRKWVRGERLDVGQLASELGVGRATLFRWVGSRELLYGEVICEAYAMQRAELLRAATGEGVERAIDVMTRNLQWLFSAAPLRKFIEHDPEFAIRVLTSRSSPVQSRAVEIEVALLRDCIGEELNQRLLDIETLAYLIVRVGESFLYADIISGRKPELDKAIVAIRILVAAEAPAR